MEWNSSVVNSRSISLHQYTFTGPHEETGKVGGQEEKGQAEQWGRKTVRQSKNGEQKKKTKIQGRRIKEGMEEVGIDNARIDGCAHTLINATASTHKNKKCVTVQYLRGYTLAGTVLQKET